MKRPILDAWVRALTHRPGVTLSVVLAFCVAAAVAASTLTLDTNQLNLLDPDLRQVKNTHRITDMNGGAGFLILALRGRDTKQLKAVATDVATELRKDEETILSAREKLDVGFLRKNAALFMKTEDLEEVRRRVMAKLKDVVKRASPFFFEIKKTEPVKLELDDILAKYQLGNRRMEEDYNVSADGEMALILIKPTWDSNELEKTASLVEQVRGMLAAYDQRDVSLVEDYEPTPAEKKSVIEYGFTGTYKTNYDDSNEMTSSLVPVSGVAFLGVVFVLVLFFRRQLFLIATVIVSLLLGLLLTFGFAAVTVGQLNIITGILGGILMGFGIDFGIHFAFRLRWELKIGNSLPNAVENTVRNAGPASFAAASGVGAAFLSLCFSDFRGFSEFGLLAGVGTFLVGGMMYLFVPALLVWLHVRWPAMRRWIGTEHDEDAEAPSGHVLERPGIVLAVASLVAVAIAAFAPRIGFEYNSRALMVEGQTSVLLQDEIRERFAISSDPVAIYSKDLTEAKDVYDALQPLDEDRFSTVDAVISIYSFVPPEAQQKANVKVLEAWREELASVVTDESRIPEEFKPRYEQMKTMLSAEPYGVEDVPEHLEQIVTNLPSAKPENHGYLTLVYAGVDLWDGKMMLKFSDELETIVAPSGKEYHAAGIPILFSVLAKIVLADGRTTVMFTGVLLVLILLIEFRSLRDLIVALVPLTLGMAVMLGLIVLFGGELNFMNVIVFPIILGYGVSHGVYLIHRFNEGVSPAEALRSVGAAVTCSTLTSLAGWGALLTAAHQGLASMGTVACFGMVATLCVSFTIMLPVLELLYRRRDAAPVSTVEQMNDAA
ncbi:MAG: MMPL family transporter [Deltaproteobacteria bacterium]